MNVLPTLTLQPSRRRQIDVRPRRQRDGSSPSLSTHCHRRARRLKSLCASCTTFLKAVPLCLTITLRCQIAILVCHEHAITQCRPPKLSLPRLFPSSIALLVYTSPEDQSGSKRLGRKRTSGDRAGRVVVELLSTCSAQGNLVISSAML